MYGGVTVPVKALASLGERLVTYQRQREQARRREPAEPARHPRDVLDDEALRAKSSLGELWSSVENDRRELSELRGSAEARTRELDFLRYQVAELEEAGYSSTEYADLVRERDRLRNVTDLLEAASSATSALSDEEGGAVNAIARAELELDRAARYDEGLEDLLNRVRSLSAELEDVVYELRSYFEELEADPNRLETVEDRLQTLRALERKYGEDVEGYLEEAKGRLARMENVDQETAELEERIREGEAKLEEFGDTLSAGRRPGGGGAFAKGAGEPGRSEPREDDLPSGNYRRRSGAERQGAGGVRDPAEPRRAGAAR
jgi:DNA repair protein RecN (Recombination protein N)